MRPNPGRERELVPPFTGHPVAFQGGKPAVIPYPTSSFVRRKQRI